MFMKLKHRHRRIILDISAVAIFILAIAGIYFGLRIALGTTTPWVAVASGSMSPALNVGDLVIVEGVPANEIKVGDIIVFDSPPLTYSTIHRVVQIQNHSQNKIFFVTKGDANADVDAPVSEDLVHGRVVYRVPILGYLALDPSIAIILVMVIVVIIFIWPERGKKKAHVRKSKIHLGKKRSEIVSCTRLGASFSSCFETTQKNHKCVTRQ
jgi:signal peptidase I